MKMLYEKYVGFYTNLENCKKQEKRVWMISRKFFINARIICIYIKWYFIIIHIIYDINEWMQLAYAAK